MVGKAAIRLPSKESVLKKIVVIVVTGRANSTAAEAVIIIKTLESDMKNATKYVLTYSNDPSRAIKCQIT